MKIVLKTGFTCGETHVDLKKEKESTTATTNLFTHSQPDLNHFCFYCMDPELLF